MKKDNNNVKNIIIILLVVVIALLIGFGIFFIFEFAEERNDIRDLYEYNNNSNYNSNYDSSNDDNNFSNDTNNENYISHEKALEIALNNVKLNQKDVYNIDIELDYKYNQIVYEVNFDYQQFEYEYYINAESGNIIKSFRERD